MSFYLLRWSKVSGERIYAVRASYPIALKKRVLLTAVRLYGMLFVIRLTSRGEECASSSLLRMDN